MTCKLCDKRDKTWSGDDPKCAFDNNGIFTKDNWNCATMNELRNIVDKVETNFRDDNSCGSIGYVPMVHDYASDDFDTFGGYIVMMWYKERGRTGNVVFMTDNETLPLTIKHAELAIETYKKTTKVIK